MHTLTTLIDASCRLLIERRPTGVYVRISRPGAALHGVDGDAYTLTICAATVEAAFDAAARWLNEGEAAAYAVAQAERHPGGD